VVLVLRQERVRYRVWKNQVAKHSDWSKINLYWVPTAQKVLRATVSAYITIEKCFCAVGTQCKFILDQPVTEEAASLLTSMSRLQMVQYFGWRAMRNQTGSWECQVLLDAEFCANKHDTSQIADTLIGDLLETNEQSSEKEFKDILERRIREFEKVLRHHVKYGIPFVRPRGVVVEDYLFRCG